MEFNAKLKSNGPLTSLLSDLGISDWKQLCNFISRLPYGRNSNRSDLSLVLKEAKGSCSSKHALLKAIAIENELDNVQLVLCIYKMSETNTPGIGKVLTDAKLDFIPEAHCYLMIDEIVHDYTFEIDRIDIIRKETLEEKAIDPSQVNQYKIEYHQQYIKTWIKVNGLRYNFEQVWNLRERCIQALTKS